MSSIKVSVRVVKVRKVGNKVCSVRGPVGVLRARKTNNNTDHTSWSKDIFVV